MDELVEVTPENLRSAMLQVIEQGYSIVNTLCNELRDTKQAIANVRLDNAMLSQRVCELETRLGHVAQRADDAARHSELIGGAGHV